MAMTKSPIEPGKPRQRRQRASTDDIDLSAVMKARKEQDRVLKARLKQIDKEISVLMNEHEQICEVLGIANDDQRITGPIEDKVFDLNPDDLDAAPPAGRYKCADCGSRAGPNMKNECSSCGASPFEQAR